MKFSTVLCLLLGGQALALPALPPRTATSVAGEAPDAGRLSKRTSDTINALLAVVAKLFPVSIAIQSIDGLISAAEQTLAAVLDIETTQSAGAGCASMTVVFARGTTEAGNVGALVGPSFFDAIRDKLGSAASLAVQGVDYPADIPGFLAGGSAAGSKTMADLVTKIAQACPDTELVMAGYSQGGQIVHNAAELLSAAVTARVGSAVIFGDPNNGLPIAQVDAAKSLVVCHSDDNICQQGDLILPAHLTYAENVDQAAAFVVSNAGALSV